MGTKSQDKRAQAWLARQRERECRWRGHLGAWRGSGLSQAEYCRRHALSPADFSWWKHELARRDGKLKGLEKPAAVQAAQRKRGEQAPAFIPVRIAAAPACFEVLLRSGRTLRIGSSFDEAALRRLIGVLESGGFSDGAALPC